MQKEDEGRYLIGKRSPDQATASLVEVLNELNRNPEVQIVEVKGQPDNPKRLIAMLPSGYPEWLREHYPVIVEPDAPIHPV